MPVAIVIRLAMVLVLVPVTVVGIRILMAHEGNTLGDAAIVSFFLRPAGLGAIAATGLACGALIFIEQAAMMTIAYAAIDGRRISWPGALGYVFGKLPTLLPLGCHLLARVLAIILPFLIAVALSLRFLFAEHDIYYYLDAGFHLRVEYSGRAVLVIVLLAAMPLLLAFKMVSWLLAIPAVLFERLGAVAAIKDSVEDSKGHRWQLGGLLLLSIVAGAILATAGMLGLGIVGRMVVAGLRDSPQLILFAIGATGCVAIVLFALASFVAAALFAWSTVRVYRDCSGPGELGEIDREGELGGDPGVRLPGKNILLGAVSLVVLAAAVGCALLSELENPEREVLVIAHRGASAVAPENTLGAVGEAIRLGADVVEIDVQLTADGEVIVFHDSVIDVEISKQGAMRRAYFDFDGIKLYGVEADGSARVGRIAHHQPEEPNGRWLSIRHSDYAELADIDVGSWFVGAKGHRVDAKFAGEGIPTLGQVLNACSGRARVLIELKYDAVEDQPSLAQLVCEQVEARGMADQVVVMSFNAARVGSMKAELRPNWTYGQAFKYQPRGSQLISGIDFVALHKLGVSPRFIALAKRRGVDLYAFTVNDPFGMCALISRGVDGIITNEVELARRMLDLRTGLGPLQRLLVAVGAQVGMFSIFA